MHIRFLALVSLIFSHVINGSTSSALEFALLLIENGANFNAGNTALLSAASSDQYTVAHFLIENSPMVDQADHIGNTPLIFAALFRDLRVAQLLIDNGANVNAVSDDGVTPLMSAARGGGVEVARLLIDHGAHVNHFDNNGDTPLIVAVRGGHIRLAQLLLQNGGDVNHIGLHGNTPLIYAAMGGHVRLAELLLEHGANVNHAAADGRTALMIALSLLSRDGQTICRLLFLTGAAANFVTPQDQPTCVNSIISPLTAIKNSVESHRTFADMSSTIPLDSGISPIEAFIFFAFESWKIGVDVFGDSINISYLQSRDWDDIKIERCQSIIQRSVDLNFTDLNMLYVVAPFISTVDDKTLCRLLVSLEFLTNRIPGLVQPNIESYGGLVNAMTQRSAHLGFLPVLKAIYTIYRRTVEIHRVVEHFRVPSEIRTSTGISAPTLEQHDAMVELSLAIRRHRAALARIPTMSTTTEIFTEETPAHYEEN